MDWIDVGQGSEKADRLGLWTGLMWVRVARRLIGWGCGLD